MIFDAAIGGIMINVDVEQPTRIIEALTSTNHQA